MPNFLFILHGPNYHYWYNAYSLNLKNPASSTPDWIYLNYSILNATTRYFLAALLEWIIPAINVSNMLITTNATEPHQGSNALSVSK